MNTKLNNELTKVHTFAAIDIPLSVEIFSFTW
jgi:hypothetical protein